jgi:hypothetical protein
VGTAPSIQSLYAPALHQSSHSEESTIDNGDCPMNSGQIILTSKSFPKPRNPKDSDRAGNSNFRGGQTMAGTYEYLQAIRCAEVNPDIKRKRIVGDLYRSGVQ